ncbi:MAG: ABC transporter ATP-binding protein [Thermoanaerobaculaceae bacterium]
MGEVRLAFSGVTKRFGRRLVLKGISGNTSPGKVLVVTGPNGSGKSTLLNILAGLMRPTQGEVVYWQNGSTLERPLWYRVLGVCAPDMAVYEELTALENLRFFLRVRGLPQDETYMSSWLERLGLEAADFRRPVSQFSSGMLQRVKLAQAMVHQPGVLLLDEPSSNLDKSGHELVAQLIKELKEAAAIIVATNDPREVAWGDEVIELAQ